MRGIIIDNIFNLMEKNEKIFFLTGDMGINLFERFIDKFPRRAINVGIAEQNLIAFSGGLVNSGNIPIAYAISNFLIHRCFEQIRNDISVHNYPVILLGTGTGFDYGPLGPTHHVIDDWGHIKSLPNFQIYCPSSNDFASVVLEKVILEKKPTYIRVPKGSFKDIKTVKNYEYIIGENKNILLVTYGANINQCLIVKREKNISVLVLNKIHPIDDEVFKIIKEYENVIVVEDHNPSTGLFSSITENMINFPENTKFYSLGPKKFEYKVGNSLEYFQKIYEMDHDSIVRKINKIKKGK